MAFADSLAQLPPVTHLTELQLLDAAGNVVATIENKPGKAGSLAVYAALAAKHGRIDTAAAEEGLQLFAEHTASARSHPGSHPTSTGCWRSLPRARRWRSSWWRREALRMRA